MVPAESSSSLRASGGTIQFSAGARVSTRISITQETTAPVTPLKTLAEGMKGQNVDASA